MLNACDVFTALGFPEERFAQLIPGWGSSMAAMPEVWEFLHPYYVKEAAGWASLDQELTDKLIDTARQIVGNDDLRAFLWHVYYKLACVHSFYGNGSTGFAGWPLPEKHLGNRAGLFYVLAVLALVPRSVEKYRSMKIPEDIIRDTLNLTKGIGFYQFIHGIPGIDPMVISWQRLYQQGRLFTLGRFQYKIAELFCFGAMLRHRQSGRRLLLAEPGMRCNGQGFAVLQGEEAEEDWFSVFEEDEAEFRGTPVSPEGFVLHETQHFSKEDWEVLLRRGDPLLDLHIPSGGRMTPEAALDSFRKAFRFFAEFFPGRYRPAIISRSWIFNTQFEELLPESNIAKLMRKCYLFPCVSTGYDGFYFLFGKEYHDLSEAPRDTSVRRAMLSILEQGRHLRLGGMLFLQEDLEHYQDEIYRREFQITP